MMLVDLAAAPGADDLVALIAGGCILILPRPDADDRPGAEEPEGAPEELRLAA